MRRWLVPSEVHLHTLGCRRRARSRPGLMPACPSNNEVPVGSLALEGVLARKPNDRREEHTRLHVLLSTRPWDVYAYDRRMPRFIAGGGHEQDALLVYNSRTQGSEPCCRPGVTWKRARAAPHHPEQPKSVRGYMGVMQAIHPRESRERNEGSRPRVERKGKKEEGRTKRTCVYPVGALNGSVVGVHESIAPTTSGACMHKRRGLRKERGHTTSDASASTTAVVLLPASSLVSDQILTNENESP
jgi:hypothetical protein